VVEYTMALRYTRSYSSTGIQYHFEHAVVLTPPDGDSRGETVRTFVTSAPCCCCVLDPYYE
jgi:hypothetical protein